MNLITYLIENKLAKNQPHANAKIALLKLQDICNDEAAVIARVKLYEAHKASKMHGKNDRAICAEMAIKGVPVSKPMVAMFARVESDHHGFCECVETMPWSINEIGNCDYCGLPRKVETE